MSRSERLRRATTALGGLLALAAGAAAAEPPPIAPFELRYEVLRNGSPLGEATLALRALPDGGWEFTSDTRGTRGLASLAGAEIHEQSGFEWRGRLPELQRYRFRQDVAFRTRERALDRVGTDGIASSEGRKAWTLRFEPGVMDRHAVALALAAAAAAGTQGDIELRVADKGTIETHRYRVEAREPVDTPAGRFDAVRVERVREKPGRTTTTWLAAELGHLPARTLQREPDGETLEMRLLRRP
jgi:hypothetical protein